MKVKTGGRHMIKRIKLGDKFYIGNEENMYEFNRIIIIQKKMYVGDAKKKKMFLVSDISSIEKINNNLYKIMLSEERTQRL